MKTFRLFGIIMMLVMGMSFTSCEDDERPLTGTWMATYEGDVLVIHCNSDGSGYVGDGVYGDQFSDYMVVDGILQIRWEGDDDYDFEGYVRNVSKKTLEYRYDIDEDWVTFYKQ